MDKIIQIILIKLIILINNTNEITLIDRSETYI